jgi:hypothetical protein
MTGTLKGNGANVAKSAQAVDDAIVVTGSGNRGLSDAQIAAAQAIVEEKYAQANAMIDAASLEASTGTQVAPSDSDDMLNAHGTFSGAHRDPGVTRLRWLAQLGGMDAEAQWFTDIGEQFASEDLHVVTGNLTPFEALARDLIADSLEHEPYGLQLRGARAAIGRMAQNSEYADGYGRAGTILDAAIDLNRRAMDTGIMREFKAFAREYVRVGGYVNPYLAVADTAISLANNEIGPEDALVQIATLGHGAAVRGLERGLERALESEATRLQRPYIRQSVRQEVEARAPRTADGRPIDPNTGRPIDGRPDFGHKPGNEFWREREAAEAEGITQQRFNERMNNPDKYQLEDPSSNRSHRYERPR